MHSEDEMHQLMLERMQGLEEALERAEAGLATGADWDIIRYECGLPKKQATVKLETISIARSESWD
jgi:hypothetical protein